jgi:predicted aconitase
VKAVTDSINLKAEKLTMKDEVIVCGGTRYIAKNEANTGLRYISQFANSAADTNVIVTCAPTRFDLQSSSCVNKEVASFNRKVQKSMRIFSHVQVCSMSTNREPYTTHGFHMNARGKS